MWDFKRKAKETMIKLKNSCSSIMLNFRLSQKFKLLKYSKFNNLITYSNKKNKI